MKVLVTGSNGYLGQGIVIELLKLGHEVIGTDFSTNSFIPLHPHFTYIGGDLFNIDHPFEYFKNPDVLLHLAWKDGFVHNSDAHMGCLNQHVVFLKKMFESNIKQIAVMGSMHEVGFFEGSINENTPCHPQTLYGIAKNALRDIVYMLSKNSDKTVQWLRGYYIVGNNASGVSIFSKIAKAEQSRQKLFPFTMGQNQYDFLDYEDFCKRVALAVTQNKIDGIINISSGKPEKLADRVERFIRDNGYNIKLDYGKFPDRPYDSKAIWGNSDKIDRIIQEADIHSKV